MRKTLKLLWCIVPFLLMNLFQVIVVVAVMVIIVMLAATVCQIKQRCQDEPAANLPKDHSEEDRRP